MAHSADDVHIPNPDFDPTDPHGTGQGHHGHHIISAPTLMIVLLLLLFFTLLTVGLSRGEVWVQDTFDVVLPQWLNVIIAMSIATIKAVLVCAYFMGLRFDKALNSIIMLVCVAAVICFLFFTAIDLGNRDAVSPVRATVPTPGGTGYGLDQSYDGLNTAASPRITTSGLAIAEFRRNEKLAAYALEYAEKNGRDEPNEDDVKKGEAKFWGKYYQKYVDAGKHPHRHVYDEKNYFESLHFGHHESGGIESVSRPSIESVYDSSPNYSVRRSGITPGLFAEGDEHHGEHDDDHADGHGDDHGDDHADPEQSETADD